MWTMNKNRLTRKVFTLMIRWERRHRALICGLISAPARKEVTYGMDDSQLQRFLEEREERRVDSPQSTTNLQEYERAYWTVAQRRGRPEASTNFPAGGSQKFETPDDTGASRPTISATSSS